MTILVITILVITIFLVIIILVAVLTEFSIQKTISNKTNLIIGKYRSKMTRADQLTRMITSRDVHAINEI